MHKLGLCHVAQARGGAPSRDLVAMACPAPKVERTFYRPNNQKKHKQGFALLRMADAQPSRSTNVTISMLGAALTMFYRQAAC